MTLTKLTKPRNDYQEWVETELSNGDIIDCRTSLGHPARHITITTTGTACTIRFNVGHRVYKNQEAVGNKFIPDAAFWDSPVEVTELETTPANVVLPANSTTHWDEEFAVEDIKIVTKSTTLNIKVS